MKINRVIEKSFKYGTGGLQEVVKKVSKMPINDGEKYCDFKSCKESVFIVNDDYCCDNFKKNIL